MFTETIHTGSVSRKTRARSMSTLIQPEHIVQGCVMNGVAPGLTIKQFNDPRYVGGETHGSQNL